MLRGAAERYRKMARAYRRSSLADKPLYTAAELNDMLALVLDKLADGMAP